MEDLNVSFLVAVAYAFFSWTVFGFFGELLIMMFVNNYIQDYYSITGTPDEAFLGYIGKQIILHHCVGCLA